MVMVVMVMTSIRGSGHQAERHDDSQQADAERCVLSQFGCLSFLSPGMGESIGALPCTRTALRCGTAPGTRFSPGGASLLLRHTPVKQPLLDADRGPVRGPDPDCSTDGVGIRSAG